ncbi:MAG: ATP-binding cassette domain-containing protein [Aquisalinus sp.]|nr:ATP-binding cassette domain-containing protein [Aquisalinus sp.]
MDIRLDSLCLVSAPNYILDLNMPSVLLNEVGLVYPALGFKSALTNRLNLKSDSTLGGKLIAGKGGGVEALQGITLGLSGGDRLGIVGHNGAGKTTLLQVMAGIVPPTKGQVHSEGIVSALFNVGIGMKMEATGIQNIVLNGLIQGLTRKEAEERIPEVADFSGLGEYLLMPVRTYSRGMVMRLAFSTATAFEPEILMMDEWIGAGDLKFRNKAQSRMKTMVGGAGIVVIASHRIPLLRNLCTHFLWLEAGRMKEYGQDPDILVRFEDDARKRKEG